MVQVLQMLIIFLGQTEICWPASKKGPCLAAKMVAREGPQRLTPWDPPWLLSQGHTLLWEIPDNAWARLWSQGSASKPNMASCKRLSLLQTSRLGWQTLVDVAEVWWLACPILLPCFPSPGVLEPDATSSSVSQRWYQEQPKKAGSKMGLGPAVHCWMR